ncbi:hypothetical protein ACH5RR_006747 [Cinchona calisaya]|uniref:Uncharacterized protein n=1 Tax=Cinchona calisaya TaxID=153742 RepID=A0ABD3AQ62_9GENT
MEDDLDGRLAEKTAGGTSGLANKDKGSNPFFKSVAMVASLSQQRQSCSVSERGYGCPYSKFPGLSLKATMPPPTHPVTDEVYAEMTLQPVPSVWTYPWFAPTLRRSDRRSPLRLPSTGTTCATVLTQAAGVNVMDLHIGMNMVIDVIVQGMKSIALMISIPEEINFIFW